MWVEGWSFEWEDQTIWTWEKATNFPTFITSRIGGGYSAEYAQKLVHVRSSTKVPRQKFKETANEFLSLVTPVAHKLGAVAIVPTGNTIKNMETVMTNSFIRDSKNIVFAINNPCCLSSDAVKKTGCLGVKITPTRITIHWEIQFAAIYFTCLSNKHMKMQIFWVPNLRLFAANLAWNNWPLLWWYCSYK